MHSHRPGETITLRVGSIAHPAAGPRRVAHARLAGPKRQGRADRGIGAPNVPSRAWGPSPSTTPVPRPDLRRRIGGPSAGLAFTLGIINTLSGGNLTGGRTVAATGTIHPDGTVGDVGGVAQKTVAVERAGATLFLVAARGVATATVQGHGGPQGRGGPVAGRRHERPRTPRRARRAGVVGPAGGAGGHSVPYDWQNAPGPERPPGAVVSSAEDRPSRPVTGRRLWDGRRPPPDDLLVVPHAPRRGGPPHLRHGPPGLRPRRGPRLSRAGGAELAVAAEREEALRLLAAEAEHRAANPVLDEATLTASLGQETARVLRSAHDAAADW